MAAKRNRPAPVSHQALAPRMVELPPLCIRAEVVPQSVNDDARTVELVFSTGAAVERMDFWSGKRYIETLSLDPAAVRLDRLNAGGPLLDSHSSWSVSDQLGAVVPGTVTLTKKEARAVVRFSQREAVKDVWQDVRDGIIRSVSVGYRVYKFEETEGKGNKLPVRNAIDWEPYEVSMVSMPADTGAKVREGRSDANACEIVPALGTRANVTEERNMRNGTAANTETDPQDPQDPQSEFIDERAATDPARPAAPAPEEPNERDEGAAAENERVEGIRAACIAAKMPRSFEDKLIANRKLKLVDAQRLVLDELKKRGGDDRVSNIPGGTPIVGDDPLVHKRAGILNALLHRVAPEMRDEKGERRFKLDDNGRQYRGLGLIDAARLFLHARGMRTTHMSKMDVLTSALGPGSLYVHNERTDAAMDVRAGMHTTSDFANLLADVQGKVLRAAYAEAPQTWMPIAKRVTLADFKPSKQLQFGEAPALLEVLEHGEIQRGTIGESKEQFQLATYARIFGITRQALINDDLDAFSSVATEFGRAARRKESDLAWAQITSNPTMGDSVALFHATHANLTASGTAISVDSLGVGRAALRKQTGIDGVSLLNLSPRFLIVPAGKETIADQFVSVITPALASSVNPFQPGGRTPLMVIAEPRLDVNSATAWYLAAGPDEIDLLLHGVLEGQEGPAIETRVGFDVDGLETKCRVDTAFKAADWRGFYKNAGA